MIYLICNIRERYMSKKISQKIIVSVLATVTLMSGVLVVPSQTFADNSAGSASLSFKGLPSILLNCTGVSNSISSSLSKITGSATKTETSKVTVVDPNADERDNCTKAIGRYIGKQMMDKITQDTINWINTGFKGEPLYVKDPGSMFKSIADKEVSDFASSIAFDKTKFPFGREAALALINSYRRTFQQNAAYSLNQYVSTGNANDFYTDFKTGGWGAWNAMVLFPQNNPIGFGLMAREQMSTQITIPDGNNAIANVQRELQQGNGFLSVKKCIASKAGPGYEYVEDTTFDDTGWQQVADSNFADANDPNLTNEQKQAALDLANTNLQHICAKWSTVTPGNAVASQLTDALGTPLKSIGLADDLNKSLSAIFDALINELSQKGLAELTKLTDPQVVTGFGGVGSNNGSGLSNLYQTISNQNTHTWNTYGAQINLYDLLIAGQDGDINTPDTLLDVQQAWIDKMNETQGELNNLIRVEKKLDYWLPGPNPGWLEKAKNKLDEDIQTLQDPSLDRTRYTVSQVDLTGYTARGIMESQGDIAAGEKLIFQSYYNAVSVMYDPKYFTLDPHLSDWNWWKNDLAIVTSTVMPEIRKIPGFEDTRSSNADDIDTATSALHRLEYIKGKVAPLYADLATYTTQLQTTPTSDPNYTTIQGNLNNTNKEIQKYVTIFRQLAPGLKDQTAIDELVPLGRLYNQTSDMVTDMTYEVIRKSWTWPVARREYHDDDIWPQDHESHCWSPLRNKFAGFEGSNASTSISNFVNGMQNEMQAYYVNKYGTLAQVPTGLLFTPTSTDVSNFGTYITSNSVYANFNEKGVDQCSFLPTGYNAHDTHEFPPTKGSYAPWDLGNGAIDLPSGHGGQLQDIGYQLWDMFGLNVTENAEGQTGSNIDITNLGTMMFAGNLAGVAVGVGVGTANSAAADYNHQGYSYFEDHSDIY